MGVRRIWRMKAGLRSTEQSHTFMGLCGSFYKEEQESRLQQGFLDLEKFGYSYCLAIFSCKETGVVGSIRKSQASDAFMVQETLKVDDNL